MKTCGQCRYFEAEGTEEGACKRRAPELKEGSGWGRWPKTNTATKRCGEFVLAVIDWEEANTPEERTAFALETLVELVRVRG